jgi:hypothetical protein
VGKRNIGETERKRNFRKEKMREKMFKLLHLERNRERWKGRCMVEKNREREREIESERKRETESER